MLNPWSAGAQVAATFTLWPSLVILLFLWSLKACTLLVITTHYALPVTWQNPGLKSLIPSRWSYLGVPVHDIPFLAKRSADNESPQLADLEEKPPPKDSSDHSEVVEGEYSDAGEKDQSKAAAVGKPRIGFFWVHQLNAKFWREKLGEHLPKLMFEKK